MPDDLNIRLRRGRLWEEMNNLENALLDYHHAVVAYPNSSVSYVHRAIVLKKLGRLKEAEADFSKTIVLQPEAHESRLQRASIRMALGAYGEALEDYRQVLFKDLFCGEAIEGFATAHLKANEAWTKESKKDRKMAWWTNGRPSEGRARGPRPWSAGALTLKLDPAAWPDGMTMKASVELSFVHPGAVARGKAGRKADATSVDADDSSDA